MKPHQAADEDRAASSWDAVKLVARDLGFSVVDLRGPRPVGSHSRFGPKAARKTVPRITATDLGNLVAENDWLLRICRDYLEALTRAGNTLGLAGWVVVAECSGVILVASRLSGPLPEHVGPEPEPGHIYSLSALGPNPIGLALDQAAAAVFPPTENGRSRRAGGLPVAGLGVPLGNTSVPVACLGVLLPEGRHPAAQALLSQVLFSARAIGLALTLHQERSANLEVAASLAHEVRNPLAAVKGFLQLTLTHRSQVPEYSGVALRELDRAISLLEDYSLFSRAPRVAPTQTVSVDGLLSEVALLTRALASAGPPVSIDFACSEPELSVRADPPRLKQVLLNLCRNAVEAMPRGGTLTLSARREGGEIVLEIADTGVGIPPSEVRRIFEPFYTTKESGTGLGLPVCRRIVEAHGGRVTLETRPGAGTTFRVHLPIVLRVIGGAGDEAAVPSRA